MILIIYSQFNRLKFKLTNIYYDRGIKINYGCMTNSLNK